VQPVDSLIPAVDSAALPPDVRNGTAQDRRLYSVALGFERMLVEQLAQQMTSSLTSLGAGDEEDPGFGAGSASLFAEQLPGTLADAIVGGGGLGLATELYRALAPEAASAPSSTTGAGDAQRAAA
jgi:Rod binding domain-containing protein